MAKLKITNVTIIDNHNADVTLENGEQIKYCGNWELGGKPQIGDTVNTDNFLDPFMELTNDGLYDQRKHPHRSPLY